MLAVTLRETELPAQIVADEGIIAIAGLALTVIELVVETSHVPLVAESVKLTDCIRKAVIREPVTGPGYQV